MTSYDLYQVPSASDMHVTRAVPPPQQHACRVGRVAEHARVRKIVLNRDTSMLCPPAQKVCVLGSHPDLSLTLTPRRVAAFLAFASTVGCECDARGWRVDRRGQGAVAVVVKIDVSSRSPKCSQNHLRRKPTKHLKMLSVCSVYHSTYLDDSLASCLGKV
jgi:hypothetical protein